ncbi:TonB-dependent receptor [Asticcacaulis sp. ZE23SCel15]|uniref:TonB-dependent receptor n=1 Tax=Asticcacaulis sp. ZE23SCel15 TaxID=3059027 RepID=UPI00265E5D08|nr:TonB-dependent receptor [Asticcacaulis sp. ZE23SCel15]WKL57933.1 TonB-dependent receptor [Asticcacaulis sp. ZE23SCel15]
MKFNKALILASSALAGLFVANTATAQSTASQEVDRITEVVVAGNRNVGPNKRERGPKAKTTIGQDSLLKDASGQTFADALNTVPGYNFTNNDAYGSSGGEIMMRGLDSARVSLTVDGIQLNDSGNYALYTNQMIDSELLCAASVTTGATDVDSMTSSATGGTINIASCLPKEEFGGTLKVAVGEDEHKYGFLKLDFGAFGPFGTRAYIAYTGSHTDTWTNEGLYNDEGKLQKNQWNAMVYQDIGDKGSFISAAVHWNENRNNFIATQSKAQIFTNGYGNDFFNTRGSVNPSDTGNVRIKSKWVITDKLTITVDPTYQYTLALGGSTGTLAETSGQLRGALFSTVPYVDVDGSGTPTTLQLYRPNITNTMRYSLQSSAIYRLTDLHTIRVNASIDRARHRQSGEITLRNADGSPQDVFSGKVNHDLRIATADGSILRRRDRLSYADVDVFSAEYLGRFLDEKLFVSVGVRHQTLSRELNQNCYSQLGTNASINPVCTTQNVLTTTATTDPTISVVTLQGQGTTRYITPYSRSLEFTKTLPNLGLTWNFEHGGQLFATYAESLSAPRTDALYDVKLENNTVVTRNPAPETSQTVELGYRYSASNFNGTVTVFSAKDQDRLVEAFVQDSTDLAGYSTFTNVGEVKRKGVEASGNYSPVDNLVLSASATWTDTELQEDIVNGLTSVLLGGDQRLLPTKGKQLTGMPEWMWTFGMNYDITSNLNLNLNAKYVGDRYYTYVNDEIAPRYTLWNAAVRYDLEQFRQGTYVQLNVVNLFDEQYLHGTGYQNNAKAFVDNEGLNVNAGTVFYQLGAPRTVSLTLRTQF